MAIAFWWLWLLSSADAREQFSFAGWHEETLLAFAAPDLVLLVFSSAIASRGAARGRSWAPLAMWLVAGAATYAALFCVAGSCITDSMWLGTSLMLLCMIGSGAIAWCNRHVETA